MNAERLLEGFNLLGDEPETVQQLRKLIVALAVAGKLTSTSETTSDAIALMKLIEDRQHELIRKGQLRKQSKADKVTADDLPRGFLSPENFVRLGSIARIEKGLTGIMKAKSGPYPLVVTAEERASCDHFDFDGAAAIVPLVSSAGHGKASLQRLHYQEGKFALGTILAAVFPHAPDLISARFLFEYLTAFKEELLVSQMIGTANVSLSLGKVSDVPVPLVSPSVQRKVDELMALCDRLEEARTGRETLRDRLAAASLARLNVTDPDTFHDDARFALDVLPAITTRPDQIKQLRQTILNLAVRGKLVPQDPKDEAVNKAIERAQLEKESMNRGLTRVTRSSNRYRELPAPNIIGLFTLPASWQWVCWESILASGDGAFKRGPFGSALTKAIFVNSGYKVYEQYCPINDDCSFARYYITPEKFADLKSFAVKAGDFLISCSGVTLGRITQVPDKYEEGVINQALLRVRTDKRLIEDAFFKMLFRSPYFQQKIFSNSTGMAIPNVKGVAELKAIPLPLPPLSEQRRIVARVDELMALCDRLEASLASGNDIRGRLLEAFLVEALAPHEGHEQAA
ncbi:MAG: restriction endonuclease subunit S [Methylocystis sp.]|uniref:restriction endonuclease subunit S n=1 Tax=Methylocystis sp. TaxID=1911079 RepID=UPI003DA3C360